MSDVIIRVENLGKRYTINHQTEGGYRKFSDALIHAAKTPLRWINPKPKNPGLKSTEDFWALKDVSFEIKQGDVVGIIGRNGAGKSTLLKVLSRITEPTTGRITLNGRVASLLEVGTGFHPELTGRENIYLNGAILGMTKSEIKSKFDEIVDFAEIEKFLDTPVKRYSSGMYVRLAFAVAAHLEPEILVVDEVLAVGDQQFQKKCLGKMQDVARGGRTVLFVSHNMAAVTALCSSAVLLSGGRVVSQGKVQKLVTEYLTSGAREAAARTRRLDAALTLHRFSLDQPAIESGGSACLEIVLESDVPQVLGELCLLVYSAAGQRVAIVDLRSDERVFQASPGSPLTLRVEMHSLPLVEGEYSFGLFYGGIHGSSDATGLCVLSVLPAANDHGTAPYPAEHRGFVEIGHTVQVA